MALIDYFHILRRRGWIILLAAALTTLSAFVFSKMQTPVYESTVFISVAPSRPDLGLTESAKNFLRNFVAVIDTNTYAQKVIDALQLETTPEALRGNVTIASDSSRFTLEIDIRNENGDLANDIAQKWADAFVQWRNDQNAQVRREDRIEAIILDKPRYTLYRPQTTINVLAGGILGVLLGALIIFVLEYLEANILRAPQDVERLGFSVLGTVPTPETARRK